jgi:hypothetical protein
MLGISSQKCESGKLDQTGKAIKASDFSPDIFSGMTASAPHSPRAGPEVDASFPENSIEAVDRGFRGRCGGVMDSRQSYLYRHSRSHRCRVRLLRAIDTDRSRQAKKEGVLGQIHSFAAYSKLPPQQVCIRPASEREMCPPLISAIGRMDSARMAVTTSGTFVLAKMQGCADEG